MPSQSDVTGQMNNNSSNSSGSSENDAFDKFIKAVDKFSDRVDDFEDLVRHGFDPSKMSQSSARLFRDNYSGYGSRNYKKTGNMGFLDRFEYELGQDMMKALKSSNFGKNLEGSLTNLAKSMGTDIKGIPDAFAKKFEKELFDSLANSNLGKRVSTAFDRGMSGLENIFNKQVIAYSPNKEELQSIYNDMKNGVEVSTENAKKFADAQANILGGVSIAAAIGLEDLSEAAIAASKTFGSFSIPDGPISKIVTHVKNIFTGKLISDIMLRPVSTLTKVVLKPIEIFMNKLNLTKLLDSANSLLSVLGKMGNRFYDTMEANVKYQQERYKADIETIVREPFEILKQAAQSVQQAWDANLKYITSANLYTKSDVQDLMQNYAQRLSNEGLTAYVSGSEITSNLAKVIQQGLSGKVAEEFAYQATLLNSEIPTQDFFSMASTYSSVVANAVKDGKSQSEAIAEANKTLKDFANNLLYAGRVASGGMSTGLTNASSLYTQSVQIAQAANSSNVRGISGVLTAVSGIIGALAPDLANSITDAVVKAATGGNDSSIVALRSLAGGNASNTEFLKNLAENPTRVFYNLFTTLDKMFTDSSDAYMEKAEGYAQLFGLSAEAFQRIDFKYLADTIYRFDTSSNELAKNVTLLKQGQTTLTKEQQVNAQINQYMLDEGLSYVLDNEVARSIQEHMWNEQIKRELQETTYGVEIVGSALELFTNIYNSIVKVLNFLNPFEKLKEMVFTAQETYAQHEDLKSILDLGKVGNGNYRAYYNLTTSGKDLGLTNSYIEMLGGQSTDLGLAGQISKLGAQKALARLDAVVGNPEATDAIRWLDEVVADPNKIQSSSISALNKLVSSDAVKESLNFANNIEDWIDNKFKEYGGVDDLDTALKATGYTRSDLISYFTTAQGVNAQSSRNVAEEQFWDSGSTFWNSKFSDTFAEPVLSNVLSVKDIISNNLDISKWDVLLNQVESIDSSIKKYVTDFTNYFIDHNVYYGGKMTAEDVQKIQAKENGETGTAIMELAKILTSNSENLEDPMVQTNALLAQILLVATTIMNKDGTSALSLADTVTGLSMGIVKKA